MGEGPGTGIEMDDLTLYNAPQSTCSQRVRYALHAKALPFEERKLDLFSGDQLKPDYLAINPNGVVPALVHDGTPVIDSAVILEYLEDVFPDRAPMRPEAPAEVAHMRAMLRFIDEVPGAAIRIPSYNLAFVPHFRSMPEAEFLALCDAKPLRREFLLRMGRTGFPQAEMDEALARLRRGAERMERWIGESGGPCLMGAALTLADIAAMPILVRMDDIGLGRLWEDLPHIQPWLDRIRRTPAFRPTYYHGALLTEKYPHLAETARQRAEAV